MEWPSKLIGVAGVAALDPDQREGQASYGRLRIGISHPERSLPFDFGNELKSLFMIPYRWVINIFDNRSTNLLKPCQSFDSSNFCQLGKCEGGGVTLPREVINRGSNRKVDIRLPGKGNSNSHGARPVHQIIWMIKQIRTSRLSMTKSSSAQVPYSGPTPPEGTHRYVITLYKQHKAMGSVAAPAERYCPYLTESVDKVVLHKSISAQICQLILYHH